MIRECRSELIDPLKGAMNVKRSEIRRGGVNGEWIFLQNHSLLITNHCMMLCFRDTTNMMIDMLCVFQEDEWVSSHIVISDSFFG